MDQLHAAIATLEGEDLRSLPESVLTEQIDLLVATLHQLDAHLTRVADAILSRAFVTEAVAA
jgi:hypothetical protein